MHWHSLQVVLVAGLDPERAFAADAKAFQVGCTSVCLHAAVGSGKVE
jgi:hypothetical protein